MSEIKGPSRRERPVIIGVSSRHLPLGGILQER